MMKGDGDLVRIEVLEAHISLHATEVCDLGEVEAMGQGGVWGWGWGMVMKMKEI
jgi:hypothetical protein